MHKVCHMKKGILLFITSLLLGSAWAQDFSNAGKEFWIPYSYHVDMNNYNPISTGSTILERDLITMTLYITSSVYTKYSVEIYGASIPKIIDNEVILPGQVKKVNISKDYFLNKEDIFLNHAIHVTADASVVVYSYISKSSVSGATLCLPTNVLGKEYYSMNYTQFSNAEDANSYTTIIAVEDKTDVYITPKTNTLNWSANTTNKITLQKGEIYQILGKLNSTPSNTPCGGKNQPGCTFTGNDLTGTYITTGTSCKKIAVFSGSGKVAIQSPTCSATSSDNLYQQLYPVNTWGQKFFSIPSFSNRYNYYRVLRKDLATNVKINNVDLFGSSTLLFKDYYTNQPIAIESNNGTISVAQYFLTDGCLRPSNGYDIIPGDPEMIILNPIEQSIKDVTLINSNLIQGENFVDKTTNPFTYYSVPHEHYISVIIENTGNGISSFRLDNNSVSANSWTKFSAPNDNFSYAIFKVPESEHTLHSEVGFNATAYGYAVTESYGYSAGTNVKDQYQFVKADNGNGTADAPLVCKDNNFDLSITLPYTPDQIFWDFGPTLEGLGFVDKWPTLGTPTPTYINSKPVYTYPIGSSSKLSTIGNYPFKVKIDYINPNGCNSTQELDFEIKVFDNPLANFISSTKACENSAITFTDQSNGNGRTITHLWDMGDATSPLNVMPSTYTYSNWGTKIVKQTVTNDIGCPSVSYTNTILINPLPSPDFKTNNPLCETDNIEFVDISSIPSGLISQQNWSFGTLGIGTGSPSLFQFPSSGTYNISLKATSDEGCVKTINRPITINTKPSPNFQVTSPTKCENGLISFKDISTTPGSITNRQWDFSGIGVDNLNNPTPSFTFNTAGTYNIGLTVTNDNLCQKTKIFPIVIDPLPNPQFDVAPILCEQNNILFTDKSTVNTGSIQSAIWDFGSSGTFSGTSTATVNFNSYGNKTFNLKSITDKNCEFTKTFPITINPIPISSFNIQKGLQILDINGLNKTIPICEDNSLSLVNTSILPDGSSLNTSLTSWDIDGGNSLAGNIVSYTFSTPGTKQIKIKSVSALGCEKWSAPIPVVVHELPDIKFNLPGACVKDEVAFTDQSTIVDPSSKPFLYEWTFGDPSSLTNITTTPFVGKHKFTAAGNYDIGLKLTTNHGCIKNSLPQTFIVNGEIAKVNLDLINPIFCSNELLKVKDNSLLTFGNIVKADLQWDQSDPTSIESLSNPGLNNPFQHGYVDFGGPSPLVQQKNINLIYTVATGSDASCIATSDPIPVTIKASPKVIFKPIPEVCQELPEYTLNTSPNLLAFDTRGYHNESSSSIQYTGMGITDAATGKFKPSIPGAGIFPITYRLTNSNNCFSEAISNITVNPTPTANAGADIQLLEGDTALLSGKGIGNGLTYEWSPNQFINNNNINSPRVWPKDNDYYTYKLKVTTDKGCVAFDEMRVKLLRLLAVPNAFSPNGDGINDTWVIPYLAQYPGADIEIYNRYGQRVYRAVNYTAGQEWDGKLNGNIIPVGTYYWIINPKNGRKQFNGSVTILR